MSTLSVSAEAEVPESPCSYRSISGEDLNLHYSFVRWRSRKQDKKKPRVLKGDLEKSSLKVPAGAALSRSSGNLPDSDR